MKMVSCVQECVAIEERRLGEVYIYVKGRWKVHAEVAAGAPCGRGEAATCYGIGSVRWWTEGKSCRASIECDKGAAATLDVPHPLSELQFFCAWLTREPPCVPFLLSYRGVPGESRYSVVQTL